MELTDGVAGRAQDSVGVGLGVFVLPVCADVQDLLWVAVHGYAQSGVQTVVRV